jgi:hypothetical protein
MALPLFIWLKGIVQCKMDLKMGKVNIDCTGSFKFEKIERKDIQ